MSRCWVGTLVADVHDRSVFRPLRHDVAGVAGDPYRRPRASENEAATIEIGGAQIMMATTSVGDGFFPVDLDVNAAGIPVAVRISMTSDD